MLRFVSGTVALGLSLSGCYDFDRYQVGGDGGAPGETVTSSATGSTAAQTTGATTTGPGPGATTSTGSAGGGGGGPIVDALPRTCLALLEAKPDLQDADDAYEIDPDGNEGEPPLLVWCDMTTLGGGWTRFHWLHDDFPASADPLAMTLDACDVEDPTCFARIPAAVEPYELLVKDLTDDAYAAWAFGENTTGKAVLAALRDKTPACIRHGETFDPYVSTSQEYFCLDAAGGCDSFKYADASCHGADEWILTLDDDSHYCAAAFKIGKATGSGNCGAVDWGYLDECDCLDERGELYFR